MNNRMKNKNKTIRFFPFALYRLDAFSEYLTKLYKSKLTVYRILFGCIIVLTPIKEPKENMRCIILTEHFYINARRKKWDDAEFLQKRNHNFQKGNGIQTEIYTYSVSTRCFVYLTRKLTQEDVAALKENRKKRIIKINALKLLCSLFMISAFMLIAVGFPSIINNY